MSKAIRNKNIKPPMLLTAVLKDLFKTHMPTLLLASVTLVSAFALIVLSHNQRNLYAELENLHTERNELDIDKQNLTMEQRMLAEHARLEVAAEQLGLKNLDVKSERIIRKVIEENGE